jgi:hypothetical protein
MDCSRQVGGGASTWELCGDFLVDAEMLLDVGDADFELKTLVDFIFLELGQLGVKAIDFGSKVGLDGVDLRVELVDADVQAGNVVFGRHVLDDMRKHISEFIEGRFLWCHMRGVYHSRSVGAGK